MRGEGLPVWRWRSARACGMSAGGFVWFAFVRCGRFGGRWGEGRHACFAGLMLVQGFVTRMC